MDYNKNLKKAMVEKLLQPNSIGITELSRETGIPKSTLFDWRKKYCSEFVIDAKHRGSHNWPNSKKIEALLEAAKLQDAELGLWLRSKGLRSDHLKLWREELMTMANDNNKNQELKEAKKRIKELEKDLRRKEKALAEASALLILKKKADAIWGKDEED